MIVIDTGKCTACGTCADICHTHCMSVIGVLLIGVPAVKWKYAVEGYLPDVRRLD